MSVGGEGAFLVDDLVQKLAQSNSRVSVGGPDPSLQEFQRRIEEIGYVFIKFTNTHGGTDRGLRVDTHATDVSKASFEQQRGIVHVEGTLTLNYVKVRCVADIDLATLDGVGHLVVLEEVYS